MFELIDHQVSYGDIELNLKNNSYILLLPPILGLVHPVLYCYSLLKNNLNQDCEKLHVN